MSNYRYSEAELIQDIERVIDRLGEVPTQKQYSEHGDHALGTIKRRFGCFNNAIEEAGSVPRRERGITPEEIVRDIQRLFDKFGKPPKIAEYDEHGRYSSSTLDNKFGSFNEAIKAAGYLPDRTRNVPASRVLVDLRDHIDQDTSAPLVERYGNLGEYGIATVKRKFGSKWRGVVRAGIRPHSSTPLRPSAYKSFIHTALDCGIFDSLYGQLIAFTGIPLRILANFSPQWVSNIDNNRRDTLITIPNDQLVANDDWVITVPQRWTDPVTGTTKQTTLNNLLKFVQLLGEQELRRCNTSVNNVVHRISNRAGIERNIERINLRATIAVHLGEREIPTWQIKHQVGNEMTGWSRSVEDYYLYLYQFRDVTHPDYVPSGTYLDPKSGEIQDIESNSD